MLRGKVGKFIRYTLLGLPLIGAGIANLLPISARGHQFLILVILLWFHVFMLFEVFFTGK